MFQSQSSTNSTPVSVLDDETPISGGYKPSIKRAAASGTAKTMNFDDIDSASNGMDEDGEDEAGGDKIDITTIADTLMNENEDEENEDDDEEEDEDDDEEEDGDEDEDEDEDDQESDEDEDKKMKLRKMRIKKMLINKKKNKKNKNDDSSSSDLVFILSPEKDQTKRNKMNEDESDSNKATSGRDSDDDAEIDAGSPHYTPDPETPNERESAENDNDENMKGNEDEEKEGELQTETPNPDNERESAENDNDQDMNDNDQNMKENDQNMKENDEDQESEDDGDQEMQAKIELQKEENRIREEQRIENIQKMSLTDEQIEDYAKRFSNDYLSLWPHMHIQYVSADKEEQAKFDHIVSCCSSVVFCFSICSACDTDKEKFKTERRISQYYELIQSKFDLLGWPNLRDTLNLNKEVCNDISWVLFNALSARSVNPFNVDPVGKQLLEMDIHKFAGNNVKDLIDDKWEQTMVDIYSKYEAPKDRASDDMKEDDYEDEESRISYAASEDTEYCEFDEAELSDYVGDYNGIKYKKKVVLKCQCNSWVC